MRQCRTSVRTAQTNRYTYIYIYEYINKRESMSCGPEHIYREHVAKQYAYLKQNDVRLTCVSRPNEPSDNFDRTSLPTFLSLQIFSKVRRWSSSGFSSSLGESEDKIWLDFSMRSKRLGTLCWCLNSTLNPLRASLNPLRASWLLFLHSVAIGLPLPSVSSLSKEEPLLRKGWGGEVSKASHPRHIRSPEGYACDMACKLIGMCPCTGQCMSYCRLSKTLKRLRLG